MDETITAEQAKEMFRYDPSTGALTWRAPTTRRDRIGLPAGCLHPTGYWYVKVRRRTYAVHRLVWLIVHGRWPTVLIDHMNGVRSDNRISNIREATHAENKQNLRGAVMSKTSCELLGVSRTRGRNKWTAQITLLGRHKYLGSFDSKEEAHAVYLEAKSALHPFSTIGTGN